jgi:hypothetical protein
MSPRGAVTENNILSDSWRCQIAEHRHQSITKSCNTGRMAHEAGAKKIQRLRWKRIVP